MKSIVRLFLLRSLATFIALVASIGVFAQDIASGLDARSVVGSRRALLIAVSSYYDRSFAEVPVADVDLESTRGALLNSDFKRENIFVLQVSSGKLPTRANILAEVERFANLCEPNDVAFVAISGRGFRDEASQKDYLVPLDANGLAPDSLVPFDAILELLGSSRSTRKALLVDVGFKSNDVVPIPSIGALTATPGVFIFQSCSPGEVNGLNDRGRGLFVDYFAQGLRGGAIDAYGLVTALDAFNYARVKVSAAKNQKPFVSNVDASDFALCEKEEWTTAARHYQAAVKAFENGDPKTARDEALAAAKIGSPLRNFYREKAELFKKNAPFTENKDSLDVEKASDAPAAPVDNAPAEYPAAPIDNAPSENTSDEPADSASSENTPADSADNASSEKTSAGSADSASSEKTSAESADSASSEKTPADSADNASSEKTSADSADNASSEKTPAASADNATLEETPVAPGEKRPIWKVPSVIDNGDAEQISESENEGGEEVPYATPEDPGVFKDGDSDFNLLKLKPGYGRLFTINGVETVFRYCPPGAFAMGSSEGEKGRNNDENNHIVELKNGFWTMETETTQALWKAVMGSNPSSFKGENLPVENVSWDDCQQFIVKLNELHIAPDGMVFSLPTEAEWEYACRAGSFGRYFCGGNLTSDNANFNGKRGSQGAFLEQTSSVKSYAPNLWLLNDMSGNVWEWCFDVYAPYPTSKQTDPCVVASGDVLRVVRGGGWISSAVDCRSAARNCLEPTVRNESVGFRCVLVSVDARESL